MCAWERMIRNLDDIVYIQLAYPGFTQMGYGFRAPGF